jgi:hypothetical protein
MLYARPDGDARLDASREELRELLEEYYTPEDVHKMLTASETFFQERIDMRKALSDVKRPQPNVMLAEPVQAEPGSSLEGSPLAK